jgi:hypothetical protein
VAWSHTAPTISAEITPQRRRQDCGPFACIGIDDIRESLAPLSSLKGRGPVNTVPTSGFVGFRPPCRQRQARTGGQDGAPECSEDERS